jgi:hypothetical protein
MFTCIFLLLAVFLLVYSSSGPERGEMELKPLKDVEAHIPLRKRHKYIVIEHDYLLGNGYVNTASKPK